MKHILLVKDNARVNIFLKMSIKTMNHKITKASIEEALMNLLPEKKNLLLCAMCSLCILQNENYYYSPEKKYYIDFYNTVSYDKTIYYKLQLKDTRFFTRMLPKN